MKLKTLAVSALLFVSGVHSAVADEHHYFPGKQEKSTKSFVPGYCEVEIYNNTPTTISIYAVYDSWNKLHFMMYPQERHYVSLDYNGYCHSNMYMEAYDSIGMLYSGYTPVEHTLTLNYVMKRGSAQLKKK